jgi:hypothetical protein
MSIDLQNSLNDIKGRISALKVTNQVLSDVDKVKKEIKDNLEKQEQKVITEIDKLQQEKKRFKRQIKSQLQDLFELFTLTAGGGIGGNIGAGVGGIGSSNYVKIKFTKILNRIRPVIQRIARESMINCVACSVEQTFNAGDVIYINLLSIDLNGTIKNYNPNVEEGQILYESKPAVNGVFPFSMNREIWNRTQNPGQSFSDSNSNIPFLGKSGQPLFDMEYTKTNEFGETGDFLKITLPNRVNNLNNVITFLNDYYSSINIVDVNAIYTQLMDLLTGAISFNASLGYGDVTAKNEIALLIQRILGLCYDARNEIDVSGVSKIPELDGVDDSFFEFSDIDQRIIEQKTNDTLNGVVEFEDCDNVKLPLNPKTIIKALNEITFVDGDNDIGSLDRLTGNLSNILTNNPEWKLRYPNAINLENKINTDFILNLPLSICMSILSPKVLLPVFIMLKALGNNISDLIQDFTDFIRKFFNCLSKLISKIGALFIKEMFEMIKRDLLALLSSMVREVRKEKVAKKYILIAKLIAILAVLVKGFIDWRKCKSVLDEIIAILNIIMLNRNSDLGISPLLLAAASGLPGYSQTRALANIVEEYEKAGIPTGPLPDGTPNVNLRAIKSMLDGEQKERLNQRGAALIPPLAVAGIGTLPTTITLLPDV